jgi:hypothetical protein
MISWRARCGESRTPGSAGGPGKPTGSNPGRAPRPDPTTSPKPSARRSPPTARAGGKTGPPPREGTRAATTRQRWQQVHDLLDRGVGLLEVSRRLNLALNPVKRYARIEAPERLVRAPQYRPTLVDPFRDYLRRRREQDPAVPVLRLLHEITELGYTGSQNLLYRYITQGRVEFGRSAISPKRLTRYLLTHPDKLQDHHRERIDAATGACPAPR